MLGDPTPFNKSVKKKETLHVGAASRDTLNVVVVARCGQGVGIELWLQP